MVVSKLERRHAVAVPGQEDWMMGRPW